MREIKFKGKTKKGVWVYGYFWKTSNGICYIKQDGEDIEVIPETVGQFTGLFDRNVVEIWEKDIVTADTHDFFNMKDDGETAGHVEIVGEVAFVNGKFIVENIKTKELTGTFNPTPSLIK